MKHESDPSDWLRGLRRHFKNDAQRHIATAEELKAIMGLIDQLLGPDVEAARTNAPTVPPLGLDSGKIESLPWVAFADGKGAWVKTAAPGAEQLKEAIQKNGGELVFAGYKYRLGGTGNVFINRFAHRENVQS